MSWDFSVLSDPIQRQHGTQETTVKDVNMRLAPKVAFVFADYDRYSPTSFSIGNLNDGRPRRYKRA
jgi:hypothetical protein